MVSSVTGLQQQIPAANTFQPGGDTETAKRTEENRLEDSTKSDQTARSNASETRNNGRANQIAEDERHADRGTVNASRSRGTEVDISV